MTGVPNASSMRSRAEAPGTADGPSAIWCPSATFCARLAAKNASKSVEIWAISAANRPRRFRKPNESKNAFC